MKIKQIKSQIIRAAEYFNLGLQIYKLDKSQCRAGKKINVGAGSFNHPHWINVDKLSEFYKPSNLSHTIHYDLFSCEPMPFKNGEVDLVYCEHVIEHLDNKSALRFFREAKRILSVGGLFRITCPDMMFLYKSYKRGDKKIFFPIADYGCLNKISAEKYFSLSSIDASIQQLLLWAFARQASIHHNKAVNPLSDNMVEELFSNLPLEEAFDYCTSKCNLDVQFARPEEHINWWTEEKLVIALKESGFDSVFISRRNQSIAPDLRDQHYFDRTCPQLSLYVEAVKN